MAQKIDYTNFARKLTYRFPRFSYVSIQINFWVLTFILFSSIAYLNMFYLNSIGSVNFPLSYSTVVFVSFVTGWIFGITTGVLDLYLNGMRIRRLSSTLTMFIKAVTYPVVLFLLIFGFKFYLSSICTSDYIKEVYNELIHSDLTWRYLYASLVIYTSVMALGISFINQMNYRFGPGVIIPMLLGRYRKPKEQDRLFMFLDLKSSTQHAEKLGHLKYSSLIRDCYIDINLVLIKNNAEIYQYVGDEVVVTWPKEEGIRNLYCLKFFFDVEEILNNRKEYYLSNYGLIPEFKAGLHEGMVTAVEVGAIKREIAYHGDTINTSSRIQGLCNQLDQSLLISDTVYQLIDEKESGFEFVSLGRFQLKGRDQLISLYSVKKI